jgi:hypothetical protein
MVNKVKSSKPFQVLFRLPKDTEATLRKLQAKDFSGYEVEGDLAIRINDEWVGAEKNLPMSRDSPVWMEDAFVWNFVWDLADACLRLLDEHASSLIDLEGDIFRIQIEPSGENVNITLLCVPSPGEYGLEQLRMFRDDIHSEPASIRRFAEETVSICETLLNVVNGINPKLAEAPPYITTEQALRRLESRLHQMQT